MNTYPVLPELQVSHWYNTPSEPSLAALRGRVVVLHAFQMLCPACVSHGIPQASAIHEAFDAKDVAVLGLHSVFEHHDVMTPHALEAFMHEYRIRFPVAVDRASPSRSIPMTMAAYGLQGTPSLIVLDRAGRLRLHHFGRADDLRLGGLIGELVGEGRTSGLRIDDGAANADDAACTPDGCAVSSLER